MWAGQGEHGGMSYGNSGISSGARSPYMGMLPWGAPVEIGDALSILNGSPTDPRNSHINGGQLPDHFDRSTGMRAMSPRSPPVFELPGTEQNNRFVNILAQDSPQVWTHVPGAVQPELSRAIVRDPTISQLPLFFSPQELQRRLSPRTVNVMGTGARDINEPHYGGLHRGFVSPRMRGDGLTIDGSSGAYSRSPRSPRSPRPLTFAPVFNGSGRSGGMAWDC